MVIKTVTPSDVYQNISLEVDHILQNLAQTTSDPSLQQANDNACQQLDGFRQKLNKNIESLQKNAEWDTFTIAFYGETNAGKSTVIETLRILLNEKSKLSRQQAFRAFQQTHKLTDSDIEILQRNLLENEKRASELEKAIEAINLEYIDREQAFQNKIDAITALIAAQRKQFSLWRKFIHLWVKTNEQKEKEAQLALKQSLEHEKSEALEFLQAKKRECDSHSASLRQLQSVQKSKLEELSRLADGEIIGTGVSDFTMDTALYPFEVGTQRFALLDVPGIEGKESKVLAQVQQAVEKAHAVFYVTSKPTAPQKGDENTPGTLEKIKDHLNAQTEVWTLFNKRITNVVQLNRPSLVSDDEHLSLDDLNKKMSQQLGENYRNTFSVSALPAFLSVAEHLVPSSDNAKRRSKLLEKFDPEDVLEKTGFKGFLALLTEQLVSDSKAKITRSNFNKARTTVENIISELSYLQKESYGRLAKQLQNDTANAHHLLDIALESLRNRLISQGENAVDEFRSRARKQIYSEIDDDISNDRFKDRLETSIKQQHEVLERTLPDIFKNELDTFKDEIEYTVQRFQKYAQDILATYAKIQKQKFDNDFEVKIDIDNGLKLTSLVATVVGSALMFWNPVGWLILAPALAGMVFAAYKAVRSFFSSSYKIAQQKQSADDNLNKIARNMKSRIEEGIDSVFPELEEKIEQLKLMLEEPTRQASQINKILINAITNLRSLSHRLAFSGEQ
ncbi:hypothetical protein [Klebsiella pneumoniae]|uniref:hypothetical protein n=1 Tax=Klebsiella pneumoniae TaxID=573 RepID=UPI000C66CEF1|nr:hypothetical protein [Klebsiella pneumoniae]PHY97923.1 hypothetical protein CK204_24675 [Klebsiella pneumoniae]QSA79877.1 hypothetical protein JT748_22635 [Klebsiella pneumoniae]QTL15097.1 hypothetical protein J6255_22635 [Klebsiella pneumoniae]QVK29264.1 hypothetical protein KH752_11065 [Klebsiella pneumoniae]UBU64394.1 hypothetical protein LDH50_13890 [Klebsiella pneumoniae]